MHLISERDESIGIVAEKCLPLYLFFSLHTYIHIYVRNYSNFNEMKIYHVAVVNKICQQAKVAISRFVTPVSDLKLPV